ncbi:MAG: hypothetical protein A3K10_11725 [Bacteroidetes bacterium RIFCSPLOWO2_12_FULL_31_6]|nr:MAG: hypothetical protein A3K10_11725 [Bacteroidetes bacterium RIFCSPLOWO2_12_FULL_31_6]
MLLFNKKYYILTLYLLIGSNVFSQAKFNNRYDINKDAEAFANVIFFNNNFILTGRSFDSIIYYTTPAPKAKISLIKTDINGNKLFNKKYGENFNDYGSILSDCFANNDIFFGIGSFTDSIYKVHQYLFKFNEQGDSLLLVHYFENDTTIETYAGSCKITRDKNLILSGVVDSTNYGLFSQMYLMKTDTLGTILWWKTYGGSQYETCTNMDTCSDGGFILGGWTTSYGGADQDPYIVKTDSNGTFQWHKTINSNSFEDWPAVVLSTQDGGILAVTTEVQKQDVNNKWVKIFFNKYDILGNLLWRKNVGDTLWAAPVFSVKEAPNGDIVALGNNQFYDILFKLNANGDSLMMQTVYRIETACSRLSQYGFDLALIDSGGYAVAGFIVPYIPSANINNTQDAWLSTYDSLGCQLPNTPYNLTATVSYVGSDTLVELNWQYNSSSPNELFIVEMYVAEEFVWDIRNDSCLLGPFPTPEHMFVTGTTYTDKLTSITKYKIPYRVFAVDTTNQLMSCHSNVVVVDLLNSVEEKITNKNVVKVYPNPAQDYFIVNYNLKDNGKAVFRLYDVMGKEVIAQPITDMVGELKISSSTLKQGIYFYFIRTETGGQVTGEQENYSGKLVIQSQ